MIRMQNMLCRRNICGPKHSIYVIEFVLSNDYINHKNSRLRTLSSLENLNHVTSDICLFLSVCFSS